jgi:RNA polymerase primary sigma factor
MRSTKTNATATSMKSDSIDPRGTAAPALAAVGLLEDDSTEDTAIRRARPVEPAIESTAEEFVDLDFASSVERVGAETVRPAAPSDRQMKDVEEGGGDSMLARYFRDMAIHAVMGPEEELETAKAVERSEIAHWSALLSYIPAAEHILVALDEDVKKAGEEEVKAPQIEALQRLIRAAKKQKGKLAPEQEREWHELSASLASAVRLPDSDRVWMARALQLAQDLIREPDFEDDITRCSPRRRHIAVTSSASPAASRSSTTRRTAS